MAAMSGSFGRWPIARGEAREPRAVLEQAVERLARADGNELRARSRVHVHELGEQELHVMVADVALDVLTGAGRGEGLVHVLQRTRSVGGRPMWWPNTFGPRAV